MIENARSMADLFRLLYKLKFLTFKEVDRKIDILTVRVITRDLNLKTRGQNLNQNINVIQNDT